MALGEPGCFAVSIFLNTTASKQRICVAIVVKTCKVVCIVVCSGCCGRQLGGEFGGEGDFNPIDFVLIIEGGESGVVVEITGVNSNGSLSVDTSDGQGNCIDI